MSNLNDLLFDEFDEAINPRAEEQDFDRVVERAINRRGFLTGVLEPPSTRLIQLR